MTHEETIAARAEVRRQLNQELELRDSLLAQEKNAYEHRRLTLHTEHADTLRRINSTYRKRRLSLIEQLDALSSASFDDDGDADGPDSNSARIARQMS